MEQINLVKNIKDFMGVQKALQDIEKIVNNLIKSTNTSSEGDVSDLEGKTGDIRITQNEDKDYIFEVRTEEGWKTPVIGNSAIKFKDKPSDTANNQKKSIDEIEAEDNSSGDSIANLTTFDEKSNKFVLARPDYDSGWQTWDLSEVTVGADNPLTLTHDLGAFPTNVKIFVAPGQATDAVTWVTPVPTYLDNGHNHGICCKITTSEILLLAGENDSVVSSDFASTSAKVTYDDGSVRVLLWK